MKLFIRKYNKKRNRIVITLLGFIKISYRNDYCALKKEIATLRKFLSLSTDITKLPKADGKLREHQLKVYELLSIVDELCRKNNLKYWLDGGSLLGAVRHRGFVPWDNDADLCMVRQDYYKLLPLLKEYFKDSEEYMVREKAIIGHSYQIRIMKKKKRSLGIDIFPVGTYSKGNLTNEERKKITAEIRKTRNIFDKEVRHNEKTIEEIREEIAQREKKYILHNETPLKNEPALYAGIDFEWGARYQIWNWDTIFPLQEIQFEDKYFYCPNDFDTYLKDLYGNYMTYPTELSTEGYRF